MQSEEYGISPKHEWIVFFNKNEIPIDYESR